MPRRLSDRITLGTVCGLVGALPWRLLNSWEYRRGYTDQKYGQLAAGLFVPKGAVDDPSASVVGKIGNQVLLAGTGVAVTYVLALTGRDQAWLKGAGVTSALWLSLYGLTTRMGLTTAKPRRANSILLSYLDHVALGVTIASLASALGGEGAFPKRPLKPAEYTGANDPAAQLERTHAYPWADPSEWE